jgi:hypothetical protein
MAKFNIEVFTDLDWETGASTATVFVALEPVFGPIDVTHLRGQDFETDVLVEVGRQFAAALRAALASTS